MLRRRKLKSNLSDDGASGKENTRKCIVSHECLSRDDLVRFVLSPDGVVTPDFSGKLPGRGAWVSADRALIDKAVTSGVFSRAFKVKATAPNDLAAQVEAGLVKSALSALGMARRMGDVVLGFEKVRAALKTKKATILVVAADGAPDGRKKMDGLAADKCTVDVLLRTEMAAALGQSELVFAGLLPGPHTSRFRVAAARLAGFR